MECSLIPKKYTRATLFHALFDPGYRIVRTVLSEVTVQQYPSFQIDSVYFKRSFITLVFAVTWFGRIFIHFHEGSQSALFRPMSVCPGK